MDMLYDIIDTIKYGVLKAQPPQLAIPSHLPLTLHKDRENDVIWCDSIDLPGFVATAKTEKELLKEVYETLLVYFDVPRYFARKMNDYGEIIMDNGKKICLSNVSFKKNPQYAAA